MSVLCVITTITLRFWSRITRRCTTSLSGPRSDVRPPDHPIHRALFEVASVPQVPAWQFWSQTGGDTSEMGPLSARAHMAAITDAQGRVMVLMTHNTDIADSWEREGEDPAYFHQFSPDGYALGVNVLVHAMTH